LQFDVDEWVAAN